MSITAHKFHVEENDGKRYVCFCAHRGPMNIHGTAMVDGVEARRPKLFDEDEWADILTDARQFALSPEPGNAAG